MKRFAIRVGMLGIGAVMLATSPYLARAAEPPAATSEYRNAASNYRIAVMQIFKRHMMALDIAANVNSPLDYNLVIHARALRETARMLEELPIPELPARDTAKFSIADQRDFLEMVSKGIDAADEVYIGARLIRFEGRNRFEQALFQMKSICTECHRTFRDPFRRLQ